MTQDLFLQIDKYTMKIIGHIPLVQGGAGLTINIIKTKLVIFERGEPRD